MSSSDPMLLRCPLCYQIIFPTQDLMNHIQSHSIERQRQLCVLALPAQPERLPRNERQVPRVPPLNYRRPVRDNAGGQHVPANREEHFRPSTRRNVQIPNLTDTNLNQISSEVTRPFIDQLDVPIQWEVNVDDENNDLDLTLRL
ncbi:hypothetical protein HAX54_046204 [Datura stramonium]|uniref:C2H2-type domain-containing protein n=1 Tax=Datura stramonium TaxID=4076 RepID=A0ABS8WII8_DATST|nr:hypothetical protein [Datura stramonium]